MNVGGNIRNLLQLGGLRAVLLVSAGNCRRMQRGFAGAHCLLQDVSILWPLGPAPPKTLEVWTRGSFPSPEPGIEYRVGRAATRLHDSCDGGILENINALFLDGTTHSMHLSCCLVGPGSGRRRPLWRK